MLFVKTIIIICSMIQMVMVSISAYIAIILMND